MEYAMDGSIDVNAYLRRIGWRGAASADLATLRALAGEDGGGGANAHGGIHEILLFSNCSDRPASPLHDDDFQILARHDHGPLPRRHVDFGRRRGGCQ